MEEAIDIAVGDEAIARLRAQAERLGAAQHPGVVELLGFSESGGVGELRTVAVEGPTLGCCGPLTPEEVAGVAAAVATTLGELHGRGIVHGALGPDVVVLEEGRRPVLCGFEPVPDAACTPADDVAALGAMVGTLVDRGPLADLARWATEADAASRPTAVGFAAAIINRVPGARLPGTPAATATDPPPSPSLAELLGRRERRRPTRRVVVGAGSVLAVTVAAFWVQFGPYTTRSAPSSEAGALTVTTRQRPAPTVTAAAPVQVWPPTSVGPAPTVERDGRRWQVGMPGDVLVVSNWACGGSETAAVLRPETGEVWHFPRWADAGQPLDGVPVQSVAGGRSAVARDVDGDGCEELVVDRGDGDPVVVHPEVAR
jgi:hypothetical protein